MGSIAIQDPRTRQARQPGDASAQLLAARGLDQVAAVLVRWAESLPGCREATLLWSLTWPGERQAYPRGTMSTERLALADAAVAAAGAECRSPGGEDLAIPLLTGVDGEAAVLLCRMDEAVEAPAGLAWEQFLQCARIRVGAEMETAQLRRSVSRMEQTGKLQRALFAIADMAGSDLDMPELLRGLHRIVAGLMFAENFYIALYDNARDAIRFIYYEDTVDPNGPNPEQWLPLDDIERGCTWYLIRDGRPLMGPTHALRRQVSGPLRIHGEDSDDWMGVPMLRGSEVRGALVVQSYNEGVCFSAEDQALLAFVANHILTALERKQGQEQLEQRVEQRTRELARANAELALEIEERQRATQLQSALYRIAELSASDTSYDDFLGAIHRIVSGLLIAENFYIAVLSDDGQSVEFPYFVDCNQPRPQRRALGPGVTEYVMRTGKALLAHREDVMRLDATGEVRLQGSPAESWLGVPLQASTGVIGIVAVQSYEKGIRYGQRELELLTFVAHKIANSLERRRAVEALRAANAQLELRVEERTLELRQQIAERERIELRLKHEVVHDALTGLPNRRYLRDRLERVLARMRRDPAHAFAVLYLDVDRFKVINDSLGHVVGDAVLKEVARRLGECVRAPDVVARLGGDEFAILLEDLAGEETPVRVAQRIIEAMAAPMRVAGKELSSSASVGIAHGELRHGSADDVLRDADVAMYRAKSRGKQRYELFDQELHREALDVLELEHDLRRAIERQEFEPYLQPMVDLETGRTIGYEALVRWNHPSRGTLAPAAFLHIAEDLGCLEAIDWLMFDKACRSVAALGQDTMCVTLNVSPRHFQNAGFAERLLQLVEAAGMAPQRVCLEITEGTLLQHSSDVRDLLLRLRDAGVRVALDDFGTGYSSLGYLHRFPLQILKIDRSFVAALGGEGGDPTGEACVRAILALAATLGLEVIAEGIETEGQRHHLQALGCRVGQGYHFARPQPAGHWAARD